ncbi:peroxisome biogenesis factor 1 [Aphelenchoides avenae]|nr:peroxisome biogenesis factor 1 [Aphelenchus avenae]
MAFPVQISTHNLPNCFGYLVNDSEKPTLTSQEYGILHVRTTNGTQFPLQVFGTRPPFIRLLLNGRFAERLGLSPGDEVVLEPVRSTAACPSMELVPETPDDWNVVENTACHVEEIFLDQIRVVQADMPIVLHVSNSVIACFRIGEKSLMDPHRVYYLNNETEVLVAPKEDPKRSAQMPRVAPKSFTSSLIESLTSRIAVGNVEVMKALARDDPSPFRVLPNSLVDPDSVPPALRSFNFVIALSNGPDAYVKRRIVRLKSSSSIKEAIYATLISLPREGDTEALVELRSVLKARPGHAWISNSLRGSGIASYTRIVCLPVQLDNLRHTEKLKMVISSEFEANSSGWSALRKFSNDLPHTPLVLPASGCDLRIDTGMSTFRVVVSSDGDDVASGRCTYFWPETLLHASTETTDALPVDVEQASDADDQGDIRTTSPEHSACSEQPTLVDLLCEAAIARLPGQHAGCHIMLTGAESSGKTTVLHLVADRLHAGPLTVYPHVIDCSEWKGKPLSLIASQLRAATESAELRRPSVILLDNIDFLNHNVDDPERRRFIQKTCRSIARSITQAGTGVLFVASAKSKKAVCDEMLKFEGRRLFTKTFHIEPLAKVCH